MRKLAYVLLAITVVVIWIQARAIDDLNTKVRVAEGEATTSEEEAARWKSASSRRENDLRELRRDVRHSVGSLDRPHFSVWNACGGGKVGCPIGSGLFYSGGVPDTFTFYPHFSASIPTKVMIMTLDDYVCFRSGQCQYHYTYWGPTKRLTDATWHLSEGCGDYIVVYTAEQSGTLYPDESITYDPAPHPTGACR